MQNKKMIVVDMDGTLLDIDGQISKHTQDYLQNLKLQGHIIVIATGRLLRNALDPMKDILFANYIIAHAGSVIYDLENKKFLLKNIISHDVIQKFCKIYGPSVEYIDLCNLNFYLRLTNKEYESSKYVKVININNPIVFDDIIHMDITLNSSLNETLNFLKENLPCLDYYVMQDSFADKKWIEISYKDVNKYTAIRTLASKLNINNEDIIAFGDGLNDIEMISNCGIGVAMGNALEEVKKVSNYVTKTHNEDGIASFLKYYFNMQV